MDNGKFFIYLLIIAGSTYLIRALPFVLFKKKIENRFIRSFLYYIPYAVLTAMTVPAAFNATGSVPASSIGIVAAVLLSLKCKNLTAVAVTACVCSYIASLFIH